MASRKDSLRKAAHLFGLAAAHYALFGEDFREGDVYNDDAIEVMEAYKPNVNEIQMMIEEARWRAWKKIRSTFDNPQKNHTLQH
ncbi:hypothetical protein TPY_2712 [Sulfobacillus acidophilus TPY]|uniref:Uncharacterized protein n=1 Tax=Sulfobacillus acidophilus (strain ATCC 700253 / DSM 10332 / NAL) TaxID=679936 RepID=G8TUM1_SULAD|nr:hypothetical protein TPY_2712 [Sulfobacillus acidophilus TPY]AEW04668.1 hypothetical protein Sulac_1168 [Sulfobacillus acidophilus DSM 10332]